MEFDFVRTWVFGVVATTVAVGLGAGYGGHLSRNDFRSETELAVLIVLWPVVYLLLVAYIVGQLAAALFRRKR